MKEQSMEKRLKDAVQNAVYTCGKCNTTYRGRKRCPWCGASMVDVKKEVKNVQLQRTGRMKFMHKLVKM